jgi:hypothetical protein
MLGAWGPFRQPAGGRCAYQVSMGCVTGHHPRGFWAGQRGPIGANTHGLDNGHRPFRFVRPRTITLALSHDGASRPADPNDYALVW